MKKLTTQQFIEKAQKVHINTYDYSLVEYMGRSSKVKIICKKHGVFEQRPSNHLSNKRGCPKCGNLKSGSTNRNNQKQFIEKAKKIHKNKYNYDNVVYRGTNEKILITCLEHGDFLQTPNSHLQKHGCPKCAINKNSKRQTKSEKQFKLKVQKIYDNQYTYPNIKNFSNSSYVDILCSKHGIFRKKIKNHLNGQGCPKCSTKISKKEQQIYMFISSIVKSKQSNREILKGKELDIYIPSKNIAIEFNGLYWHSDEFKKDTYHINKTKKCQENGIQLIHIFEDEWDNKQEIVKSRLRNLLNVTENRIFARKTEIKLVQTKEKSKFLEENHIQGKVGSNINLGLYYNNELVSLMTFGKLRKNLGSNHKEGHYELLRFCNKLNTSVVGGFSKLLKHFQKNYEYKEIISYADLRWSLGNVYLKNGFTEISRSFPNYFYFSLKGNKRKTRFKYRKSELVKQGFDKNKTERQIMKERGFLRIYDCGTIKFKL